MSTDEDQLIDHERRLNEETAVQTENSTQTICMIYSLHRHILGYLDRVSLQDIRPAYKFKIAIFLIRVITFFMMSVITCKSK